MDSFKKDEMANDAKRAICFVFAVIMFFIDFGGFYASVYHKSIAGFICTLIFGVGLPAMIIRDIRGSMVNTAGLFDRTENEKCVRGVYYLDGELSLKKGDNCTLYFGDDRMTIAHGLLKTDIFYRDIKDIGLKNHTQLVKDVGISIPGMMLGNAVGGIGTAMLCGIRLKKRKRRDIYFAVIYSENGRLKSVAFKPKNYDSEYKIMMRSNDVRTHCESN